MKLLYMMHIPWKWIKQRPHYFAEMLSNEFETTILCKEPFKFRNSHQIVGDANELANKFYAIPFYKLPLINNISFLRRINDLLLSQKTEQFSNYTAVFITSWTMFYFIEELLTKDIILIYDAMDDDVEFPFLKNDKRSLNFFYVTEKKLINRADVIFCSSDYLKSKIISRTGTNKEITVINNAYSGVQNFSYLDDSIKSKLSALDNIIMYIGVISSWFDFSAIKALVNSNEDVNVVLFGPLEVDIYEHPRVHYLGVLKRDMIFEVMSYAKILMMPFIVNELIRSVNPVKVYEYIATDKHIIVSYYEETIKFKDYVNFYSNNGEFVSKVNVLLSSPVIDESSTLKRQEFISQNSWQNRFQILKGIIKGKLC